MGSGSSTHHQPHDMMVEPHQYPDMNVIFRGIPKMMQMADDMHSLTGYVGDMRNLTLCMAAISALGMICFLVLKFSTRKNRRRKRSILRHAEEGYGHGSMPRYYYQSQYAPEPWDRPKSTFSHQSQTDQEKKPIDSRNSPETKPNGNLPYKSHPSFKKTSSQPSSLQTSLEDNFSPELIKKAPLAAQENERHHSTSRLPHKV